MISGEVRAALDEIFSYASAATSWILLKKELLKSLPSEHRTDFSTRDPLTKQQIMNDFEREVIALWHDMGGNNLLLMQ